MTPRERAVRDLYRRRPRNTFARVTALVLLGLGLASWFLGDFDVASFFAAERAENLARFLARVVPAPLRDGEFDTRALVDWVGGVMAAKGWHAAGTTLAISVAAIALAGVLALVLAVPAARTFATPDPHLPGARPPSLLARYLWRAVVGAARSLQIVLRALPEYVWAFLLLAIFGPTAWPAILALALHNAGILGKLGAETLENVEAAPLRALRGLGARRRQMVLFAALPAAFGRFLLYFFYRWETCVREATVLGMLGVVSLGYYVMFDARPRGRYDEMVLLVLVGSAIVLVGDLLSAVARAAVRRAA